MRIKIVKTLPSSVEAGIRWTRSNLAYLILLMRIPCSLYPNTTPCENAHGPPTTSLHVQNLGPWFSQQLS